MPGNPQIPTGEAFAWRLAAFYAALFVALGVQLPFLPVWLAGKGLEAGEIGIVLAIPMIVRVFAIPVATRAADRREALRAAIVVAATAAAVGYAAIGFAQGALAIMATFALASAFFAPLIPLADAYAFRGLGRHGRSYGPVRLWGSAAFVFGTFAAGILLDVIAASDLIWLIVGAMVLTMAAACALAPPGPSDQGAPRASLSTKALWRDRAFLAVVAGASLIQASHAIYYGFSTLDWQAAGFDGVTIGALWSVGVIAEIVLFAVSGRLPVGPLSLILIGAAGGVVRWTAMALDPPFALLPALQCLHALSFGATHLGALGFVARAAPSALAASAQGYLAVALGGVAAASMAISGMAYATFGSLAYLAMAMLGGLGGIVCATGFYEGRPKHPKI